MLVQSEALARPDSTGRQGFAPVRPGDRPRRLWLISEDLQKSLLGLLFVGPALVTLLATFLYPLAYNLWLSLHSYNLAELYLGTHFIGLRNYSGILQDPYFWSAFR